MAQLCYLKVNVDKYMIAPAKRSQILWSAIWTQMMVFLMLYAMNYSMFVLDEEVFDQKIASSFMLFLVKLPSIQALHFVLTPEVRSALSMMKFSNQ